MAKTKRSTRPFLEAQPELAQVVRGFSVDSANTYRIDQIISVHQGILSFGVPIGREPIDSEISTAMGKSLDLGVIVPGLVCRVPFSRTGFGLPCFFTTMLENKQRFTPREFGQYLERGSALELLDLEAALVEFHRARIAEVIPWVLTDPYDVIMGETRESHRPKDPLAGRGNRIVAHLSLFMHHVAGAYLKSAHTEALFLGRTVKLIDGDQRYALQSFSDLCSRINAFATPEIINIAVSPIFWTTQPIVNAGEGGGDNSGIVAPWTCPLRSLTARINVRILSQVAAGITPKDEAGDLRAIAALRNQEMRERRSSEDAPRTLRLRIEPKSLTIPTVHQIPNAPDTIDHQGIIRELQTYHQQCSVTASNVLFRKPHAAHVAFVFGGFDRSRKDWSRVKHAALLWIRDDTIFAKSVCEVLKINIDGEKLTDSDPQRILSRLVSVTPSYLEGLPFRSKEYRFADLPDVYASQVASFTAQLHRLLSFFGIRGVQFHLSQGGVYRDDRGRQHRGPNTVQATIKYNQLTYTSQRCSGRTIRAAKHKAAASLIRELIKGYILPWAFVTNPEFTKKGVTFIPSNASIGALESNSSNWEKIRGLHPLITTFDLLMRQKGWMYEVLSSEDMLNRGVVRHLILRIYSEDREFITIETVRDNSLGKKRDAMRRALRYFAVTGLIDLSKDL